MRFGRRKPRSTTAPMYIGFADDHPALAGTTNVVRGGGDPRAEDVGARTAHETHQPAAGAAGADSPASEELPRAISAPTAGAATYTSSGQSIASSAQAGGDGSDGGGRPRPGGPSRLLPRNTARIAGAGAMMNGGGRSGESKGKKVMMRLGAVKSKVNSLQLLLAESASISSSTATRYMRASDTDREGSLGDLLQLGTPTPRSHYRESLHANLIGQGAPGAESATSIVAARAE